MMLEQDLKIAKMNTEMWTDNVFALRKWVMDKRGCGAKEVRRYIFIRFYLRHDRLINGLVLMILLIILKTLSFKKSYTPYLCILLSHLIMFIYLFISCHNVYASHIVYSSFPFLK